MSKAAPNWDHYATFLAVMQGGSLSAAARALGLTQPTARRQIEALEQALGTVLFTRGPAGLTPTATAERLLAPAQDMAATAESFRRAASGTEESSGTVRLTCSDVFGTEILPPVLAVILDRYPGIEVELQPGNTLADLLRRDADIALRMTRPRQPALVARKVGAVSVGLFAQGGYLARHGTPRTLAELPGHRLIGEDRGRAMADAVMALGLPPFRFSYRCDSDLAQMAALRAGVGLGFIQTRLAAGLVRILPDLQQDLEVWLVMHEDQRGLTRLRRVFDALAEALVPLLRLPLQPTLSERLTDSHLAAPGSPHPKEGA